MLRRIIEHPAITALVYLNTVYYGILVLARWLLLEPGQAIPNHLLIILTVMATYSSLGLYKFLDNIRKGIDNYDE